MSKYVQKKDKSCISNLYGHVAHHIKALDLENQAWELYLCLTEVARLKLWNVLKRFDKSSGYTIFVAMHAQDSVSVAASALLNDCDLHRKYSSVWKVEHLEQKWKDMQSRQIIPLNV